MSGACECGAVDDCRAADAGYVRSLRMVVALNGGMFVVGVAAAVLTGSVSIRADVLDFLGDAVATSIGLALVGRPARLRARAAFIQGIALGLLGVFALASAVARAIAGDPPEAMGMGAYGVAGFAVNVAAALLMLRHRNGDAGVRAVWLYSRNDALGNLAVVAAAGGVALAGSRWPDVAAGAAIAVLFLHSAWLIAKQARSELASAT